MSSLRAPFRHPMFRRYFAGQAISQVGDFVFFVALPWQVLVLTGSAADLGGVYSTYFAAQLILLLAGGVLTDRVSRRTLVVLSDVLQGILVGAVAPLARDRKPPVIVQVREGWRYVARVPWLWITILVFAIVNAAEAGPRGVVLPAFVGLDLGGGYAAIGLVLSTMAAGSLLGFFLPNFLPSIRHRGLVAYIPTAVFGVSIALMAFSPHLTGILALGFFHGVAVAVFSPLWRTAMMGQVPEGIRGRVFRPGRLG